MLSPLFTTPSRTGRTPLGDSTNVNGLDAPAHSTPKPVGAASDNLPASSVQRAGALVHSALTSPLLQNVGRALNNFSPCSRAISATMIDLTGADGDYCSTAGYAPSGVGMHSVGGASVVVFFVGRKKLLGGRIHNEKARTIFASHGRRMEPLEHYVFQQLADNESAFSGTRKYVFDAREQKGTELVPTQFASIDLSKFDYEDFVEFCCSETKKQGLATWAGNFLQKQVIVAVIERNQPLDDQTAMVVVYIIFIFSAAAAESNVIKKLNQLFDKGKLHLIFPALYVGEDEHSTIGFQLLAQLGWKQTAAYKAGMEALAQIAEVRKDFKSLENRVDTVESKQTETAEREAVTTTAIDATNVRIDTANCRIDATFAFLRIIFALSINNFNKVMHVLALFGTQIGGILRLLALVVPIVVSTTHKLNQIITVVTALPFDLKRYMQHEMSEMREETKNKTNFLAHKINDQTETTKNKTNFLAHKINDQTETTKNKTNFLARQVHFLAEALSQREQP